MITEDKVTELFCIADDFCKFFDAMMEKYGSSDKCVVFVPKRWIEMKIAKILSLPLVTPN